MLGSASVAPPLRKAAPMGNASLKMSTGRARLLCALAILHCVSSPGLTAQQPSPTPNPSSDLPNAPTQAELGQPPLGSVSGIITDTDAASISAARVTLEDVASKVTQATSSDGHGAFLFSSVSPGQYIVAVHATGFASWKIKDVILVHEGESFVVPEIQLGVEAINTTVNAISMEDLAEQQITAEEHQRILGVL